MSVSTENVKNVHNCDGYTNQWAYTFPIVNTSDIKIYVTDTNGNTSQITTNYSIDTDNKIVTYPTTESGIPISTAVPYGYKLTLIRETPYTQETDFNTTNRLNLETLENSLDKLTYLIQQLKEKLNRAIIYDVTNTSSSINIDEFLDDLQEIKDACNLYQNNAYNYMLQASIYRADCETYYNMIKNDYSGTLEERPTSPTFDMFYWATDVEQYYRYSTKANKWFLLG